MILTLHQKVKESFPWKNKTGRPGSTAATLVHRVQLVRWLMIVGQFIFSGGVLDRPSLVDAG